MNRHLDQQLRLTKKASLEIAKLSAKKKEMLLMSLAQNLKKHKNEVFSANTKDVLQLTHGID